MRGCSAEGWCGITGAGFGAQRVRHRRFLLLGAVSGGCVLWWAVVPCGRWRSWCSSELGGKLGLAYVPRVTAGAHPPLEEAGGGVTHFSFFGAGSGGPRRRRNPNFSFSWGRCWPPARLGGGGGGRSLTSAGTRGDWTGRARGAGKRAAVCWA